MVTGAGSQPSRGGSSTGGFGRRHVPRQGRPRSERQASGATAAGGAPPVPHPGSHGPLLQQLAQHRGPVGHEAVDPQVEHGRALLDGVDRPDVHLQPAGVRGGEERARRPARGHRSWSGTWAHPAWMRARQGGRAGRVGRQPRGRATPRGPSEVQTSGPKRRRAAAIRRVGERGQADPVVRPGAGAPAGPAGASTPAALISRLKRRPARRPAGPPAAGSARRPPMRASDTCFQGRCSIRPVRSVTRSREASWKATRTPSAVTRTSVSR